MNVTYQDKAAQRGEGHTLLQNATKQLEEVLGPSAEFVSAEWEQGQDARGRPIYQLTLSDSSGRVAATLTREQLRSPGLLRGHLLDLWGDLLQKRSDAQMKKLQQLVNAED